MFCNEVYKSFSIYFTFVRQQLKFVTDMITFSLLIESSL